MDLGVHLVDLGLWLLEPSRVELEVVELSESRPVEDSAQLALRLDDVPMVIDVSWSAPLPSTEISFQVETDDGPIIRWENVNGSFFHFHTLHNGAVVLDRETTLREDSLRAFAQAIGSRCPQRIDARVYALLDRAYARST